MFLTNNALTPYPLDASATLRDDTNTFLPEALLSDLSITFPESYGYRAFLSAVSVVNDRMSLVISAANATKQPLAVGVSEPGQVLSSLALTPLVDGVVGRFTPGDRKGHTWKTNYRFSQPSQSWLSPRTVYSIPVAESQNIGAFYVGEVLEQIVEFTAAGDIELLIADRVLGGVTKRSLVIRLRESGIAGEQTLQRYASEMPRPEARSCGDPQPAESINGVSPDCCGRIFIELRGCAVPIPINNHCGVVLDCPREANGLCPDPTNYDPIEDQTDECISQGQPSPLDPPSNQPKIQNPWKR